jgi:hypothetical protein
MPFNTDRRLFHGRPRPSFRRFGVGIKGSRTFHWSSLRSRAICRIGSLMRQPAPTPTFDRMAAAIASSGLPLVHSLHSAVRLTECNTRVVTRYRSPEFLAPLWQDVALPTLRMAVIGGPSRSASVRGSSGRIQRGVGDYLADNEDWLAASSRCAFCESNANPRS